MPEKLISKKADEQTAEIEGEEENPPQQAVLDNLFAKLDQLTHLLTEEQPGEAVSVTAPQFRDKLKKGLLNIFLETELEELNQPQNTERVKFTRELFTDVRRTLEARVSYGEEPTSPSYPYPPFDTDLDDFETEPENEQPESAEPVFEESEIELQPQTQDREAVIDKLVSILLDNQELLGTGTGAVGPVTGKTKKLLPQTGQTSEILQVLSAAFYQATREALALNTFKAMDDSPWPTARLSKGGANGHAQLVPPVIENEPLLPPKETERWVQVMWKQREELSDLDADALDLLCHFWLEQAKRPEDAAVAHIDEFLEMRGLKKNQSGSGRRGGYKQ